MIDSNVNLQTYKLAKEFSEIKIGDVDTNLIQKAIDG